MIIIWLTADDVAKEVQSSVGYVMRERLATRDVKPSSLDRPKFYASSLTSYPLKCYYVMLSYMQIKFKVFCRK